MVFQCENRAQDRSKNPTILTLPVAFSIWPVANSKTIHFSTNKEHGPLQKKKTRLKTPSEPRACSTQSLSGFAPPNEWIPPYSGVSHTAYVH